MITRNQENQLVNNLVSISASEPLFAVGVGRVLSILPEELRPYAAIPQLLLTAGDAYWLHYQVKPVIRREPNPDEALEEARQRLEDYVASDRYRVVKTITTLNDTTSTAYAAAVLKTLAEMFKERLERELEKAGEEERSRVESFLNQLAGAAQRLVQAASSGDVNEAQQALTQLQSIAAASGLCSTCRLGGAGGGNANAATGASGGQRGSHAHSDAAGVVAKAVGEALSRIAKAMEKGAEAAERAHDLEKLVGAGGGVGGLGAGKSPGTVQFVAQIAVSGVKRIDRIIALGKQLSESLPRMVRVKRRETRIGEEYGGYRLSRKPSDAVPRDLVVDEIFESKMLGGGFTARQRMEVSEGAYCVLVDKSGSMKGQKEEWARSVALAIRILAARKRRRFYMRFFDATVYELLSDKEPQELLRHILEVPSDGGTSIDRAIRTALEDLRKMRDKTNTIIIITDGEDEVTVSPEELRAVGARLVAVMVGGNNEALRRLAEQSGGAYMSVRPDRNGGLTIIEEVSK